MPLLRQEAEHLSNNQLISGVIDEIIERDDLFAILPFLKTEGKAYVYNREKTLGGADWLDPNDSINESAAGFQEVVAKLRILAGDVDIDKFLQATMSDTNSQMAVQIAKKAKAVARMFHQTLATGDATVNPKAFDGLPVLLKQAQDYAATAGGSQIVSAGANGNPLTLTMLDELCDAVPNGADVIVMRRGTIRAFRALLRATYGTDAVMQQLENFGRPMLTHNGIPVIMNEFLSGAETQGTNANTTSVYALRLNESDGLHGLYGGDNAGIVVENIGTVQNKDATRIRLKWYTGLALKSTRSIAGLKGVTNI
ncbi:major capsid protein [Massilia sp. TN1-12]|uniref:major capsid protein n=1 Tax=Massilia paldalensis TaxID=3377675 RepID=UPI00384BC216